MLQGGLTRDGASLHTYLPFVIYRFAFAVLVAAVLLARR